jgi:hypothetical protein
VDWEAYLGGLGPQDRLRAVQLAEEYGLEAAGERVRYHLPGSLDHLEKELNRAQQRCKTQVPGLYESIDVNHEPAGWKIEDNNIQEEPDGTAVVRTDVLGPNGARGYFVRGFNPVQQRVELREAFLRHDGETSQLPSWVEREKVPWFPSRWQRSLIGTFKKSISKCTGRNCWSTGRRRGRQTA